METRVIKCKGLSVKAKLVLRSLARWAREEDEDGVDIDKDGRLWDVKVGWCWPGQARLMDETEYAKSTIQLALEELIGKGIVTIIRGGGQFKVGGNDVRLSNIYCVDMDKAELIHSRDPWEHKKKVKGGLGKSKEERALDARTRILERQRKEAVRQSSLDGIQVLDSVESADAKPANSTDVEATNPTAKSAENSSTKPTKNLPKSVPYSEAPDVFCKVATAGGTIADLENALGYTIQTKIPRDSKPTPEQWQELWTSLFPKAKLTVTTKTVPTTAATAGWEAETEVAMKTSPESDALAKRFWKDVMDSKAGCVLPIWSALFFEYGTEEYQGLIDAVIDGDWKEFIQTLKVDPVEWAHRHAGTIKEETFWDSDFFTPEYATSPANIRGR
jgi:hypothetical protein